MATLPEHPRCPFCGSSDTERHWGDVLMEAGGELIAGFADGYFLGGTLTATNENAVTKGVSNIVDKISQKYTCNNCNKSFTLNESEYSEHKILDNDGDEDEDEWDDEDDEDEDEWDDEDDEDEDERDDEDDEDEDEWDDEDDEDDEVERESFEMAIDTSSSIPGQGVIIQGTIGTGSVHTGDIINISEASGVEYQVGVVEINYHGIHVDHAEEEDECEILIIGIDKSKIKPRMVASYVPLAKRTQEGTPQNALLNRGKFLKALIKKRPIRGDFSKLSEDKIIALAAKYNIGAIEALSIAFKNETTVKSNAQQVNKVQNNSENEKVYLDEYKQCLADGEISASEIRLLHKLATSLGISVERARELEASFAQSQLVLTAEEDEYLVEYKEALVAGELTPTSRRLLNKFRISLGISEERAIEIENNVK